MNTPDSNQQRVFIIHDTDADGICAAWCIGNLYSNREKKYEIVYFPQRAGIDVIPEDLRPTDIVYLLDRCYPPDMLMEVSAMVKRFTVLDHHKSALDKLCTYLSLIHI